MRQIKRDEARGAAKRRTAPKRAPRTISAQDFSVRSANWLVVIVLALVPFHAILTVWGASLGLNYDLLRLWSAFLLLGLSGIVIFWLCTDQDLRNWAKQSYLVRLVAVFATLSVLFGLRGVLLGSVGWEAFGLGLLLNLRYLVFFVVVMFLTRYSTWLREYWFTITMGAGVVVAAFATLQYTVLPHDILRHIGYGSATIEPFDTINSNADFIRVSSTLRGANPLGAYLLVLITLLVALWGKLSRRVVWSIALGLFAVALFASFSRSAWIGTIASVGIVMLSGLRSRFSRGQLGLILLGIVILTGVAFTAFRGNVFVQNAIFHTDDVSKVAKSSNDQRESALRTAAIQVTKEPLGRGTGSAGPASVHNTAAPSRIAENYYLQIGQETGWFGLFAYLALTVAVGFQLWQFRRDRVAFGLFAAFVGLGIVNMVSHAWADDTLAFIWWGLAGMMIGSNLWQKNITTKNRKHSSAA